ncbi:glycosyltransferase 87 family protein [Microbacterium sp.]|jgi:hypothetical protein|uniref:glycosyltransferase 87 family protein n=1 Tax=Microbacterium sp. TaxID=51671 RepID=UPI002C981ECD|nr:glycosyltransferase 87 family protein [Microbacterium sp.]HWL78710.1 glycosyltransferase 87 family protein [Microbacterium sp.]
MSRMLGTGVERVLYALAGSGLIVANIWVIVPSLFVLRLWEDEAFNLTVPLNLLDGLGYTSDGTLSGSTLTPFDARISTGPVVLLPVAAVIGLGADPVIGGRSIALLFWIALVAGAFVLGRAAAGRWGGLVGAAVPLALNINQLPSPVQGPTDILGEIPSAALIVWALVAARRRPWLGGLLVGLAVQAKFIALLAIPALAVFVFFSAKGEPFWARVRRVLPAAGVAAATAAAVELWRLLALGPAGYFDWLREFAWFLLSGGQPDHRTSALAKALLVLESWFVPAAVAAVVALVAIAGVVALFVLARRSPAAVDELIVEDGLWPLRDQVLLAITGLIGTATYVAWWGVSSHTPLWIRHPSPGLLSFAPVIVASALLGWRALARFARSSAETSDAAARPRARGLVLRGASLLAMAAIGASVAAGVIGHVGAADPGRETLASQRAVAAQIAALREVEESDWLAVQWGSAVSIAVLAGKHVGLTDAGEAVRSYPWMSTGEPQAPCDELLQVSFFVVCAPAR